MCSDNWNAREGVRLSMYCSRSVLLLPRYATETGDGSTADTVAHIVTQYQNRCGASGSFLPPMHTCARNTSLPEHRFFATVIFACI